MTNTLRRFCLATLTLASIVVAGVGTTYAAEKYSLVIQGGRVIDPASRLDGERDVGISNGRIAAISKAPLAGDRVIDATNLIVAPGFVDLHSHAQTPLGQRYQVRDGVTTALELEAGAYPVGAVGNKIADQALINFGASAGYFAMRIKVLEGKDQPYLFFGERRFHFNGAGFKQAANPDQLEMLRRHLGLGLDQGGLGIGLLLDYMSNAVTSDELRMIFEVSAQRGAPVFAHIRRGVAGDPAGLVEVIDTARATGASVHICHMNANAMGAVDEFLGLIARARAEGIDVTAEAYPYNAGSTQLSAEVFDRDWQKIFGISYEDVQWAETGEYFTEALWHDYRERFPNGTIIHHYGKEPWTRKALTTPGVLVASDAMPVFSEAVKAHPRGMGTFTRILGRYVREEGLLELSEALARMSFLPAERMASVAPAFNRKGRLQVGADADVVVFDPRTVSDRATYTEPFKPSRGIEAVIVNGEIVVQGGEIQEGVYPGRYLTGDGR